MASEAVEKIAAHIRDHGDMEILGENGDTVVDIEFNDDDGVNAVLVIIDY